MKIKPIIGTLEEDSAIRLKKNLSNTRVNFVNFPMIETLTSEINILIKETLENIEQFDWIIFTSRNGVKSFFDLWKKYKKTSSPKFEKTKFATIGKSSAQLLKEKGFNTDFVNPGNTSGEFVHHIDKNEIIRNTHKVLLVLGNLAPNILYSKIKEITPAVKRINVYQTLYKKNISLEIYNLIEKDDYSFLLFTSPSAYDNFSRKLKTENINELRIAAIGKTTANFIKLKGAKVSFIPTKSNFDVLSKELTQYIKNYKF